MPKNILYLHGFNSSPLSIKAEQTRQYFEKNFPDINFICPQLATSPKNVIQQLESIIEQAIIEQTSNQHHWLLMGSSLGGYFAAYLANKYQCPAVLINPAIKPFELLEGYLGEHVNPYTHNVYQVTKQHMVDLKTIEQKTLKFNDEQKNNYLVMIQTGDEVLNYQQAAEKYQHCRLIVEQGGDHSFIGFDKKLPMIADFLVEKLNILNKKQQ